MNKFLRYSLVALLCAMFNVSLPTTLRSISTKIIRQFSWNGIVFWQWRGCST